MTVENAQYLADLNPAYPAAGDPKSEGDDHIRLIKLAIKNSFPNLAGQVTKTAAQLNSVPYDFATLQQLCNGRPALAKGGWNGTLNPPPAIDFGWDPATKRVRALVDANFATGGFLVDSEFLGGAQSNDGYSGHQRMPGNFELQYGQVLVDYGIPNAIYNRAITFPRGFTVVGPIWLQSLQVGSTLKFAPTVPSPQGFTLSAYGQGAVKEAVRWFAIGWRDAA